MILIFPILTFFGGKMTSRGWRQILLLALWDIMSVSEWSCYKDLKTEKMDEICLSIQKI